MHKHQPTFSVHRMANIFRVSRSGYYYWLKNRENISQTKLAQQQLDQKVNKAFFDGKQREGARRLQVALAENGDNHDVKTIRKSMERQGLVSKAAKRFKVTTDSNHQLPIAPNLLNQDFSATAINQNGQVISPIFGRAMAGSILL